MSDDEIILAVKKMLAGVGRMMSTVRERGAWQQGGEVVVNPAGPGEEDDLEALVQNADGYTRKVGEYTAVGGHAARLLKESGSLQEGRG